MERLFPTALDPDQFVLGRGGDASGHVTRLEREFRALADALPDGDTRGREVITRLLGVLREMAGDYAEHADEAHALLLAMGLLQLLGRMPADEGATLMRTLRTGAFDAVRARIKEAAER